MARAADEILGVARLHGWEVTTGMGTINARKGKRWVFIEFSVRGGVTYANSESRRFTGTGKKDQVLRELTRK